MTTAELIEHLKDILSAKSDAKLAEMLGMSNRALSMLKLRNGSLAEHVIKLAEREGYDLNLLLLNRKQAENKDVQRDLILSDSILRNHDLNRDSILVMDVKTPVPPLKPGDLIILDTRETRIVGSGIYAIVAGMTIPQLRRVHVSVDGSVQILATEHDPIEKFSSKQARQITAVGRAVLCLTQL